MKQLPLDNAPGEHTLVSDDTYEWARHDRWLRSKRRHRGTQYAYRTRRLPDGKEVKEYLHRLVLGLEQDDPRQGDHRNKDGLDNQLGNLRIADHSENLANQSVRRDSKTKLKGVTEHRASGKFQVQICFRRICYQLGLYASKGEAAVAYNHAARILHREFAHLNCITSDDMPAEDRRREIERSVDERLARKGVTTVTAGEPQAQQTS